MNHLVLGRQLRELAKAAKTMQARIRSGAPITEADRERLTKATRAIEEHMAPPD